MKLDRLMESVREREPAAAEIEQAAARVRSRLFPQADAAGERTAAAMLPGAIRSCADFVALMPAALLGTLDAGRKMLLDVHVRECVGCRKALDLTRTGARTPLEFKPRHAAARPNYAGWAMAASVLIASGAAWWGFNEYPALGGGPRATVDSVDGAIYKVSGDALTALAPGAELGENDSVRTAKNSRAVLRLNDGSKIELNQRAQVSVTRNRGGSTIHLGLGNIIVEAAKQRRGTLQVVTADCNVSVKGTVFAVDSGIKGSRVAVVDGTVWVDHGEKHDVLHRGDETATAPDMGAVPVRQEFEWSRNSAQYLEILGELGEIRRKIAAIPPAGLRYESTVLNWLPADVPMVAAIPNFGGTLGEAGRIFEERLKQSPALNAWWESVPAARREGVERTIRQLETASGYVGNEIVIAFRMNGGQTSPLILASILKPGLEEFIRSQMPANSTGGPAMRFDNGLFAAASSAAELNGLQQSNGFTHSALYGKLAQAYEQGAGWLFGADLGQIADATPSAMAGARFVVAQSRSFGGETENRASVTFAGDRKGVASWLSAPGPMGSLEFVSPDASFAVSMLLKNPALIADDLTAMIAKTSGDLSPLKSDLAGAFAGEVTIAMDGPVFPAPSWKIAAEVYYPDRLQNAVAKLVTAVNAKPGHQERTGDLKMIETMVDGRPFYSLKFDKLPWQADWTFVDGYWVAAANRELLVRSIQNRQTGYTLAKSDAFRSQLPHDGTSDFSAVIYHNLGQTLAAFGMAKSDSPGVITFWTAPDRIDVATMGSVFGMKLESLLAMQGQSPLTMLSGLQPGLRPESRK